MTLNKQVYKDRICRATGHSKPCLSSHRVEPLPHIPPPATMPSVHHNRVYSYTSMIIIKYSACSTENHKTLFNTCIQGSYTITLVYQHMYL